MDPYRSNVSFPSLVEDCCGILGGWKSPFYPGSTRGSPSLVVCVFPGLTQWDWSLWEGVVYPILVSLGEGGPPPGGWNTDRGRMRVESVLRRALVGDPQWVGKIDWGT